MLATINENTSIITLSSRQKENGANNTYKCMAFGCLIAPHKLILLKLTPNKALAVDFSDGRMKADGGAVSVVLHRAGVTVTVVQSSMITEWDAAHTLTATQAKEKKQKQS